MPQIKPILLDLKLPKGDGPGMLEKIRNDLRLRSLPVVMLTSSREERDLVCSDAMGADVFVVKPVDFHEFSTAVRELGVFWSILNEPPPRIAEP